MRDVRWTIRAQVHLANWIDYLAVEAGERTASRAYAEVTATARSLEPFPERYRASQQWEDMRELPFPEWNRLAIYRVERDKIVVIAFYDMRQDLSAVNPLSE